MYESPIRLLVQQVETSVREQQEKQIFEAVQKCIADVDREQLIKALAYDRYQYSKGYADGHADAMPRWISVEERLPEEKEDVAAIVRYNENVWEYGIAFRMDGSWRMNVAGRVEVTHWMPLPEPPKEATP